MKSQEALAQLREPWTMRQFIGTGRSVRRGKVLATNGFFCVVLNELEA